MFLENKIVVRGMFALMFFLLAPALYSQEPRVLNAQSAFDTALAAGTAHDYVVQLSKGESVELVVTQMGVDVVVEVRGSNGSLLKSIDSPTGRNGDEQVEIIAQKSGKYVIRVRPFDSREPPGKYRLAVTALRSARATAQLQHSREAARDSAVQWLRPRSIAIAASGVIADNTELPPFDSLAERVRVLAIGEATHGSREFGDVRLSLTRRLVARHGYRIIGIEASATRLTLLNRFVAGGSVSSGDVTRAIESGWIGRRALRELVQWLRAWNATQANERVQLVGVDAGDNADARDNLRDFLATAYGKEVSARWAAVERELAAADSQTLVFGDSGVDPNVRKAILEILAMVDLDEALLARRFGEAAVESARQSARILAEFADFNGNGSGMISHSRDWYMAMRVLRAVGTHAKAVYWAHNAHVANPRSTPSHTTGAFLRDALGCGYGSLAVTFNEGAFVAQIPNDTEDRLAISSLPPSPEESTEGVLSRLGTTGTMVTWSCVEAPAAVPAWLRQPHAMHWVGGLYLPGSPSSEAFRSFDLLQDFNGAVYLPRVTADEMPTDRPLIPSRQRSQ